MIRIELEPEAAKVLHEVLSADVAELGYEIANTDSHDFREKLREKKELLERVVADLGG